MHRNELSDEHASALLVGQVRNMLASPGVIFSPWHGLDLAIRDEHLCRVSGTNATGYTYRPLASMWDVHDMNDEDIVAVITERYVPKSEEAVVVDTPEGSNGKKKGK